MLDTYQAEKIVRMSKIIAKNDKKNNKNGSPNFIRYRLTNLGNKN